MHQRVSTFGFRGARLPLGLVKECLTLRDDWHDIFMADTPFQSVVLDHRQPLSGGHPAPIAAVPDGVPRPRISVMLPTFEPDAALERALESVLSQSPAATDMQIAVVDDGSRSTDVRRLVTGVDRDGRVEIHLHRQRLGLGRNWNRAIALARGELVHLLHQDDYVLPGFYERVDQGFRRVPALGMAFCRTRIVDGGDRLIKTTSRQQWTAGVLGGWLPRIAERQRVQTPAVVVPRATYERLGGFRTDLRQAVDWEMWVRIAADAPVWYDPCVLSVYRRHRHSESTRLLSSGAIWPDLIRAIAINAARVPEEQREKVRQASARWYAGSAIRTVEKQLAGGEYHAAALTLEHLPRLLEFLPDSGNHSLPLRRAGLLQERLRSIHRRAA